MNRVLVTFILCVIAIWQNDNQVYAQVTDYLEQQYNGVIPPDPVSAEFQKYSGYPVSHATGQVNVDIPLYTMKTASLSIPFSLSYHTSGVKVTATKGMIGLGWSLNPGFKITRTIMGGPDDKYPTDNIGSNIDHDYLYNMIPRQDNDPSYLTNATQDGQYDIFNIIMPNLSATFILQWVGGELKPKLLTDSPIDIVLNHSDNYSTFLGFDVTDAQGVVYEFGPEAEYNEDLNVPTSWLLETINPPGTLNNAIFTYEEKYLNAFPPAGSVGGFRWPEYMSFRDDPSDSYMLLSSWWSTEGANVTLENQDANVRYIVKLLDEISFESGEMVLFNYSDDVLQPVMGDLYYKKLNNIQFKNQKDDQVKLVEFDNDGMQLEGIDITGGGSYAFEYDEQAIVNITAQDFFGYHNGVNNSDESMIPAVKLKNINNASGGANSTTIDSHCLGDRSPHATKMQARILKRVIYPTGGATTFTYEPHQYLSKGVETIGYGLRVKQVDTYDPDSEKKISKSYVYGSNESGNGNISLGSQRLVNGQLVWCGLDEQAFISEKMVMGPIESSICETEYGEDCGGSPDENTCCYMAFSIQTFHKQTVSSTHKYASHMFGPPVWYDEVTEYINVDEGKTVYKYEYTPTDYAQTSASIEDLKIATIRGLSGDTPRLKRETIYGSLSSSLPLQMTEYNYSNPNPELVIGLFVWNAYSHSNKFGEQGTGYESVSQDYSYYDIEINRDKLLSMVRSDYDLESVNDEIQSNGQVVSTTTYSYQPLYTYNIREKSITTSDAQTITEAYYYPSDLTTIPDYAELSTDQRTALGLMVANNQNTAIIEKEVSHDGVVLTKELFGYYDFGNDLIKLEEIQVKKGSNDFESRLIIGDYDDKGNMLNISKASDVVTEHIWGYNDTYPVVKAENASSGFVATVEDASVLPSGMASLDDLLLYFDTNIYGATNYNSATDKWKEYNENLRAHASNAESMITTYTYKPNVGITSITNPSGITVFYHYDTDFKLDYIKDKNGNEIEHYEYHFASSSSLPALDPADNTEVVWRCNLDDDLTYEILNPGDIDFGDDNVVGTPTYRDLIIENTTSTSFNNPTVVINDIELPTGFRVESGLGSIAKDGSRTIKIAFDPSSAGSYSGTAEIISNAAGTTEFGVSGEADPAPSGSRVIDLRLDDGSTQTITNLDFGTVGADDFIEKYFRVYNTGSDDLNITSVSFSDFVFQADQNSGTISQGNYLRIRILFQPGASGIHSGTITVNSNRTSGNNALIVSGVLE